MVAHRHLQHCVLFLCGDKSLLCMAYLQGALNNCCRLGRGNVSPGRDAHHCFATVLVQNDTSSKEQLCISWSPR